MCNALCECLKCPGKVVCCCCSCACKMLVSILCSGIVILIIIGVIVYFVCFHNKDDNTENTTKALNDVTEKMLSQISDRTKRSFRDYFANVKLD